MKIWISGTLLSLLGWGTAFSQEPAPVGEEFQVNTYTTSWQRGASVAVEPQGNFVVVWKSWGSCCSDDYLSFQGQRFDASGVPLGPQFQVNHSTTVELLRSTVAADSQGNFVVVWNTWGEPYFDPDWNDFSIQAQGFDASGAPLGPQFQVNSWTGNYQYPPDVASYAEGSFVVVWSSLGTFGTDPGFTSIQGQRIGANGIANGGQFQINSYGTHGQYWPAVAADPQGNFVVVWGSGGSYGTDSSDYSIQGQRFDDDGHPLGGEFQVNSYTTGPQCNPAVAVDSQGNFFVVWASHGACGSNTDDWSIQGQRFDADGIPLGGEFQVNSDNSIRRYNPYPAPAVAADSLGNFVVVWHNWASYGNADIQGQRFDADGTPLGSQFQVNSYTTSEQLGPDVATDADGNFVVVWSSDGSYGTDTDSGSIQGQRFEVLMFADGFESGDTSSWSSAVP